MRLTSSQEALTNGRKGFKQPKMGDEMKYIKIILTIIAILLAVNIVKSMIPSATATSVQDVNITSVYRLRTLPLNVEIAD